MEKVRRWCGQPSDRGRLKTEQKIDPRRSTEGRVSPFLMSLRQCSIVLESLQCRHGLVARATVRTSGCSASSTSIASIARAVKSVYTRDI